jgi:Methyltransferase domain
MDHLESHLSDQIDHHADFFWHRARWGIVRGWVPPGACTVLDVGAGAGLVGDYLAADRPAARYEFIEPIASLESRLEQRWGAERNRSGSDPLDDVDVVTLLDVIEHVEDDRGLLADLTARTTPGTTFVVTVPAKQRLWSSWDVALGHHRRYERSGLRTLVGGLPLDVLEVSYLFPELVPAALWRAWRGRDVPAGSAEFPELPRVVDRGLLAVSTVTARARRLAPTGTSLVAVARRR